MFFSVNNIDLRLLCITVFRLLRFQPQRLESMDMLNVTLLALTFSLAKSLKISFPLHTTAMYDDLFSS